MGETSADIQREVTNLRDETSLIVEELEFRARHAMDLRAQASTHPFIAGGMIATFLVTLGLIVARIARERNRSALKERFVHTARERLGSLKAEAKAQPEPTILKRVLWSMLAAGTVALASLLARRLLASLWAATLKEPPPKKTPA